MESEDILDGPGGGVDELRSIVARAGRRRRRSVVGIAAATAAAALLAGGGIGYAVSDHGSGSQAVVSGGQPQTGNRADQPTTHQPGTGTATAPEVGTGQGGGSPVGGSDGSAIGIPSARLTRIFTRTVGDVTVRGYQRADAPLATACAYQFSGLEAEVSTPDIAGVASSLAVLPAAASSTASPKGIESATAERLGEQEGAPVDVVIVHSTGAVAQVEARFTNGTAATDHMAPIQGWSVLVAPAQSRSNSSAQSGAITQPTAIATVTATDSAGRVVGRQPVGLGGGLPLPAMATNGAVAAPLRCCTTTPPVTSKSPPEPTGTAGTSTAAPAYRIACTGSSSGGTVGPGGSVTGGSAGGSASSGSASSGSATAPTAPRNLPNQPAEPTTAG